MSFETLLNDIKLGKTIQDISCALEIDVECDGNKAYTDGDLYHFIHKFGAEIIDIRNNYAIIRTLSDKYYQVPCEEIPNRFDMDLPNEFILSFDKIKEMQ